MEKPVGSVADVRMLLGFIDEKPFSERAGKILGRLQEVESSNSLIARRLAGLKTPWAKKNLASAVAQRGIREGVDPLLGLLGRTPEPDARIAIWSALARLGSASDLPAFLDKVKGASPEELRAIESALVNAARSEHNPTLGSADILAAYLANSGSDDEQTALTRSLCRIGNKNALPKIQESLKSPNTKLRNAVALALGEWPTAAPVAALEELLVGEKDNFTRQNAIVSLGNLALLPGDTPQDEIAQALITAYNTTKDQRTQTQILTALGKVADPAAVDFFKDVAAKNPRRKAEAAAAEKAISVALSKAVPVDDAPTTLPADRAVLSPGPLTVSDGVITNWLGLGDHVSWLVKIDKPGACEVKLTFSSNAPVPGRYVLNFGKESFSKQADNTGGPANFRTVTIGTASFSKPGLYRLWIRPVEIPAGSQLMRVKEVTLTRAAG